VALSVINMEQPELAWMKRVEGEKVPQEVGKKIDFSSHRNLHSHYCHTVLIVKNFASRPNWCTSPNDSGGPGHGKHGESTDLDELLDGHLACCYWTCKASGSCSSFISSEKNFR
jgi:hypothetical protein